ncbi:MAG: hypothetical protein A3B79_06750 [Deltaproteobacteria bacterium RIFCSPHIGHO2_02_FULL_50_15]|nr:MAG: hypothetical protein A3B79_06750 [Deltaproteobacteria bacterium RIFCSPHIGHO2_02_FULL_50_15]
MKFVIALLALCLANLSSVSSFGQSIENENPFLHHLPLSQKFNSSNILAPDKIIQEPDTSLIQSDGNIFRGSDQPQWVSNQLLVQFYKPVWDDVYGNSVIDVRDLKKVNREFQYLFDRYGVYQVNLLFDVDYVLKSSRDKYPQRRWEALAKGIQNLRHQYVLYLQDPSKLNSLKNALEKNENVKSVSYNHYLKPLAIPNDTYYGTQWGLPFIHVPEAWDITTSGGDILVGVTDGGFQEDHVDLEENVAITGDVVDGGDPTTGLALCDNHGTHVAGIIGATGNNGQGVSGVAWNVPLALYRKGSSVHDGLCWATEAGSITAINDAVEDGVDIINNSYGYTDGIVATVQGIEGTVLFINGAGNNGADDDLDPVAVSFANLTNTLQVANSTNAGTKAGSSDFGASTVHLAAPGTGIRSTIPANDYGWMSGTSMAAPMVAGVAALAWAQCPALSVAGIRQVILDSVVVNGHWDGLTVTEGIVDAEGAVLRALELCETDSDGDGLLDVEEYDLGTDPHNSDTDGDGLSDFEEVYEYGTNPLDSDTDHDGMNDDAEIDDASRNPLINEPAVVSTIVSLLLDDDDTDGDGVVDPEDNCPEVSNVEQADFDEDNIGDACDDDVDGDGVVNEEDNCPLVVNGGQEDLDLDDVGNACDADLDGDGINNNLDNCLEMSNAGQADLDGDVIGDVCDVDMDGDGVNNNIDNCSLQTNASQADKDGDGLGNVCDPDIDGDGVLNVNDNCDYAVNPDQADEDGDGRGDACEFNWIPWKFNICDYVPQLCRPWPWWRRWFP